VTPRVPIISALVISPPTQCERLINSRPERPGKYFLPPEKPTTSWEGRSDHDCHVGFGNVAVDAHVDRGVGKQSTGELAEAVSADHPQRGEDFGRQDSWG
jgi:hypothetical protein